MNKFKTFLFKNKSDLVKIGLMAIVAVVAPLIGVVEAATSDSAMPWSTGITSLQSELTGPLPKIGATIAVAVCGMMLSFGEMSSLTKRAVQVVFGLSIAIGAATFVATISGKTVEGLLF
ncbi:TrbC/VirB2 family protein [Pelosinus propionicus]|uniref:Type IV secretion system protein VirB2 n=1 Tax=Pelosinus propionicus DSM 13327 TaxID=1123291 RepID=A0A1I4PT83_9FIRM|nr:TrbC/VirB2 family protein [Pelosinus propionicus]SFM30964.1 type IV secretion system protein VirB2 [Pelosinus propionicus DSM 13327]